MRGLWQGVRAVRSSVTAIAALMALATGEFNAVADEVFDRKVYPGSFCAPENHRIEFRYDLIGVTNSETSPNTFICPVLNDGIIAGWNVALVQVRGLGVRCVGLASPWGTFEAFVTPSRTSNAQGLTTLSLGSILRQDTDLGPTNIPLTDIFAHYEIVCVLPPNTSITRYYIRE